MKRSTFEIYCEGRNIGFADGSDVGDEGKGEVSGLGNCMKWSTIY